MIIEKCKLCDSNDDVDYLHPLYDGRGNNFIYICEKCRIKLFQDSNTNKKNIPDDLPIF